MELTTWWYHRVCANCDHAEEMHRTRMVSVAPCRVLTFDLDLGAYVYCGCACFRVLKQGKTRGETR